jgi:hypothetical protein
MPIDSATTLWIECTLHNDPRLIMGLGALAGRAALHAGLSDREQEDLSAAAAQACRETFSGLDLAKNPRAAIKVFVARLADRIEVRVESAEEPTARHRGIGKNAAAPQHENSRSMEGRLVDRMQFETGEGHSRITLVKFCRASKFQPAL